MAYELQKAATSRDFITRKIRDFAIAAKVRSDGPHRGIAQGGSRSGKGRPPVVAPLQGGTLHRSKSA